MRLLLLAALVAALPASAQDDARPRNLVLLIADGFGPASATLARAAHGGPLALDGIATGTVETSATDSRVTDSASGATAYACGIKTYNGAIGVDAAGAPCRTVLEAARDRGMATGLVVTTRLTHATPASFAAHVAGRDEETAIAAQLAASGVDVMLGGGAAWFYPEAAGGRRTDGRDLVAEMEQAGYTVARDRGDFDVLDRTPAVALLAADQMAYEIDRPSLTGAASEPSLAEMAVRALDLLAASETGRAAGFFVMIEGSRIDHAAHGNDGPAHLRDILAYDAAVAAVLAWAERDGQTLVVSTADHETGGLTLGDGGVYAWEPAPLLASTMSAERLGGLRDGVPTGADVAAALGDAAPDAAYAACTPGPACVDAFRQTASTRAGLGWTTSGHTAVDVGLYAFGPGADRFTGAMGNDAVGRALFAVLGLTP